MSTWPDQGWYKIWRVDITRSKTFFVCKLLGKCPGPFALQSADPTRNGQIECREKDRNINFQRPGKWTNWSNKRVSHRKKTILIQLLQTIFCSVLINFQPCLCIWWKQWWHGAMKILLAGPTYTLAASNKKIAFTSSDSVFQKKLRSLARARLCMGWLSCLNSLTFRHAVDHVVKAQKTRTRNHFKNQQTTKHTQLPRKQLRETWNVIRSSGSQCYHIE